MTKIVVGERELPSSLWVHLDRERTALSRLGVKAKITEATCGGHRFFSCCLLGPAPADEGNSELGRLFRQSISTAIRDTILADYEPALLERGVRAQSRGLSEGDRERLRRLARNEIDRIDETGTSARSGMIERLMAHFRDEACLHVNGFFRFRLQAYRAELVACVEAARVAIDRERERKEFVALLRFFLASEEPKVSLIHIFPKSNRSFMLLDGDGSAVDHSFLEGFVFDLAADGEVEPVDLLVSALVTLSPTKIVLHLPKDGWDLDFLVDVFGERLLECDGCRLCSEGTQLGGGPQG